MAAGVSEEEDAGGSSASVACVDATSTVITVQAITANAAQLSTASIALVFSVTLIETILLLA